MPVINFTMFVDKIQSGEKRQTIRKTRKRPIKAGDRLYLYTGLRTKYAENLGFYIRNDGYDRWLCRDGFIQDDYGQPFVLCKEVHDIEIWYVYHELTAIPFILIDNECLGSYYYSKPEDYYNVLNEFAKRDGFNDWTELFYFFEKTHGLPFHGQVIRW